MFGTPRLAHAFSPDGPPPNGYAEAPAKAAGYSWIVRILPYLEEGVLHNLISAASDKFQYEAFSTTGSGGLPFAVSIEGTTRHFATVELDELMCPDYRGGPISRASSDTARPPVTIAPYSRLFNAAAKPHVGVAISNYFALSATHLACMALGPDDAPTADAEPPNGVIVPGVGLEMNSVLDGTSKTLIVCETKEPAVNSWYDGTVCWTVGANPSASSQPTPVTAPCGDPAPRFWVFPRGTANAGSLNYGPGANGKPLFAPKGTTPAQTQPVSWGPSSDHSGGVVIHLACDASVHAIAPDIDPDLYLQLITRAGCEPTVLSPDTGP